RAITVGLGIAGATTGLALIGLPFGARKPSVAAGVGAVALAGLVVSAWLPASHADELVDDQVRANVVKQKDGLIAHMETEYNDIFITKRESHLVMSFQRYRQQYTESAGNLKDPDELPVAYTQTMTLGAIYPSE